MKIITLYTTFIYDSSNTFCNLFPVHKFKKLDRTILSSLILSLYSTLICQLFLLTPRSQRISKKKVMQCLDDHYDSIKYLNLILD